MCRPACDTWKGIKSIRDRNPIGYTFGNMHTCLLRSSYVSTCIGHETKAGVNFLNMSRIEEEDSWVCKKTERSGARRQKRGVRGTEKKEERAECCLSKFAKGLISFL